VLGVPGDCSGCVVLDACAYDRLTTSVGSGLLAKKALSRACCTTSSSCSCEAGYAELVAPHHDDQGAMNCLKPLLRRWKWSRQHVCAGCAPTEAPCGFVRRAGLFVSKMHCEQNAFSFLASSPMIGQRNRRRKSIGCTQSPACLDSGS